LQSQLEFVNGGGVLLLLLPDEPEIEMGFGRMRLQPEGLVEGRNGTFEVALLGEPDADSVINPCGWGAGWRIRGRRRRFAGGRQLRQRSSADQQQESTTADKRPA
jgi:hypothetical protein